MNRLYKYYTDNFTELKIARFRNGVKLVRPDVKWSKEHGIDLGNTVTDAFALPFNVGFLNLENRVENLNIHSARILGFSETKDAIGISMRDVATSESAQLVERCNKQTILLGTTQIFEQHILRNDDLSINRLQFVTPWYDENNNIVGIFGCNLVLGKHPLAESLMSISKLGLMNIPGRSLPGKNIANIYLTKREINVLHHTVNGKTAKNIAESMGLSVRTIEHHLENIKSKFNVTSKSELIEKAIEEFDV